MKPKSRTSPRKLARKGSGIRECGDSLSSEVALRKSEARFRSLVTATSQIVWITDANGSVIGPLPDWQAYTGQSDSAVQGAGWADALHRDDAARALEVWKRAVTAKSLYDVEYRIRRHDGAYHFFRARGVPVLESDGTIREWVGACTDIHEERMAAVQRDQIFSLSLNLMCIARVDGYFQRLNPAFLSALGHSEKEMLNRPFLDFVHPDDREATLKAVQILKNGGSLVNFENRYVCRDGTYRRLLWACVPEVEEGLLYATARDVTEQREAEARNSAFTEELKRSNEELERFAYVSSHDLQEPLRTIASFSELLAANYRGRLDADADEFIQYIVDGATRMQRLIDDLLTYSRVGRQPRRFAPVDLGKLLQGVMDDLDLAMEESKSVVTHEPLPVISGDEVQLSQLLQNLIGNAIKFRRPGKPARVQVSAARGDRCWKLAVRDDGIGIDPQYFDRVFIIFQRLHGREEYPGTGIGLAVCKKIVERHGGRIWVKSRPGKGSTFQFTLQDQDKTP